MLSKARPSAYQALQALLVLPMPAFFLPSRIRIFAHVFLWYLKLAPPHIAKFAYIKHCPWLGRCAIRAVWFRFFLWRAQRSGNPSPSWEHQSKLCRLQHFSIQTRPLSQSHLALEYGQGAAPPSSSPAGWLLLQHRLVPRLCSRRADAEWCQAYCTQVSSSTAISRFSAWHRNHRRRQILSRT